MPGREPKAFSPESHYLSQQIANRCSLFNSQCRLATATQIFPLLELLARASYIIWEELGGREGGGTYYDKWQEDYGKLLEKAREG